MIMVHLLQSNIFIRSDRPKRVMFKEKDTGNDLSNLAWLDDTR